MKLIVIGGQSNGTDRFQIPNNLDLEMQALQRDVNVYHKTVYDSNDNGDWETAYVGWEYPDFPTPRQNTQTGSAQVDKFGVLVSMGYKLKYTYNHQSYIIPAALGGSYIADDVNPSWNVNHVNDFYDNLINWFWTPAQSKLPAQFANKEPILVWIHGESDADTLAHGNAYYANMVALIAAFRADTGFPNAKVILTKLRSDYGGPALGLNAIRTAQVDLATNIANVYLIDTDTVAFPLSTDGQHYNPIINTFGGTQSAINLGEAIADVIGGF